MSIEVTPFDYYSNRELYLEQYKTSDNLNGIIEGEYASAIEYEQALFEIKEAFKLSTSVGVQLDAVAEIYNLTRISGETDEALRLRVYYAITGTYSGTPEEIIASMRMLGATYIEYKGADALGLVGAYLIVANAPAELTQSYLESISPVGVRPITGFYLTRDDAPTDGYLLTEDGFYLIVY